MSNKGEKGLPISRNLNLTTDEGLWKFYRGVSIDDLEKIKSGKWRTLDNFFTTNLERALDYSFDNKTIIEIKYQVAFNHKEQLRIFNKLHSNRGDFFDIICDRDLSYSLIIGSYSFRITDVRLSPCLLINNNFIELNNIIDNLLKTNEA